MIKAVGCQGFSGAAPVTWVRTVRAVLMSGQPCMVQPDVHFRIPYLARVPSRLLVTIDPYPILVAPSSFGRQLAAARAKVNTLVKSLFRPYLFNTPVTAVLQTFDWYNDRRVISCVTELST